MKAIKKPVSVEVWQLPKMPEIDVRDIQNIFKELEQTLPTFVFNKVRCIFDPQEYRVNSLEGEMRAYPGDYIVQGNHDDVWVVQKDIFEDTYDIVDDAL